jgi:hypothetical protein
VGAGPQPPSILIGSKNISDGADRPNRGNDVALKVVGNMGWETGIENTLKRKLNNMQGHGWQFSAPKAVESATNGL